MAEEPLARCAFSSSVVEGQLYVWGGKTNLLCKRKSELSSSVCRYEPLEEKWSKLSTKGPSPPGLIEGASTSNSHYLYTYGGYDDNQGSLSEALHQLDVHSLLWKQLSAHGPSKKSGCEMVAHKDKLVLFGGYTSKVTDELHIFDLNRSEYIWYSMHMQSEHSLCWKSTSFVPKTLYHMAWE